MGSLQALTCITIAKTFLLPQFIYVASVLDPSEGIYDTINMFIRSFVNTGSTLTSGNGNGIKQNILYGSKAEGGMNFKSLKSLKISWIKRYATDRLDDHWADIIDERLKIKRKTRAQILT